MNMNKRYIAYFDVLGYSNRIKGKSISDEFNIQKKFIDTANSCLKNIIHPVEGQKIFYIHFSDTHIYYTTDDSEISFASLILTTLNFMILSTIKSLPYLPLRGSICYGNFIAKDNIFVGSALREAYNLEKDQDWLGYCLSKKCIKQVKLYNYFKQFVQKGFLVKYKVPMKSQKKYDSYVINLESFIRFGNESKAMPITKRRFWRNIFINKGLKNRTLIKLNKASEKKLENTQEFFEHIEKIKNKFKG